MNIEDVRVKWKAMGFDCDLWTDPPGQVRAGMVHPVDGLLMVVEGGLALEMGGNTSRPVPGEEVFIPAGQEHTVRNGGGAPARWLFGHKKPRRDPDACL